MMQEIETIKQEFVEHLHAPCSPPIDEELAWKRFVVWAKGWPDPLPEACSVCQTLKVRFLAVGAQA